VLNAALGIEEDHTTSHGDIFGAFTMWDGREPTLDHQATDATMGHAQTLLRMPKNADAAKLRAGVANHTGSDIARFEKDMLSLPRQLAKMKWQRPQIDHQWDGTPFEGAPVFDMATVQKTFFSTVKLTTEAQKRGMKLFVQNKGKPACITCHNLPETLAGGTRLFASADIAEENSISRLHKADGEMRPLLLEMGFKLDDDSAITDAHSGNDMLQRQSLPKFKMRLKDQYGGWHVVETPDPGLAGQTGRYEDLHKFKVAQLRGIKTFKRFFHENHDTLNLMAVVQHYDNVLESLEFKPQEQADVVEFLKAL
jgi:cytochrome c peroxidase